MPCLLRSMIMVVRQPLLTALKLGLCAFALNFAWEMLQAPFFVGMLEMPWWEATQRCLQASFGDAVMIVIAFAAVALVTRDWLWMARPRVGRLAAFMLVAATQALALEWLMLRAARWSYVAAMPVDPIFGLGLAPILQWLILPAAIAWLVRRRTDA